MLELGHMYLTDIFAFDLTRQARMDGGHPQVEDAVSKGTPSTI
jgi:hypothetical protein